MITVSHYFLVLSYAIEIFSPFHNVLYFFVHATAWVSWVYI